MVEPANSLLWQSPSAKVKAKSKFQKKKSDDNLNPIAREFLKKIYFTSEQMQALMKIFNALTGSTGKMDRMRFRDFISSTFDITDDLILDRMFTVLSKDFSSGLDELEWILGISILTRGNLEDKIAFAFKIYDVTGDEGISRKEMDYFLRTCMNTTSGFTSNLLTEDMTETLRDIGDIIFKKLDIDRNGLISQRDFHIACMNDPVLLESMGQCFPSNKHIKSFLVLFAGDYTNFQSSLSHPDDPGYTLARRIGGQNSFAGMLEKQNIGAFGFGKGRLGSKIDTPWKRGGLLKGGFSASTGRIKP